MTTYNVGLNTGNTGSLTCMTLSKAAPGSVQTMASGLFAGSTSSSVINRMVFVASFPVSGPGTVTNSILKIANADAMSATAVFELRKLLTPFTTAQATWNSRASGTAWNVAGVLTGTDVDATVLATGTAPTTGSDTLFNITGAGLDAFIQGCIDGSITLPQFLLAKQSDTSSFTTTQHRFRTDIATTGLRPVLTFDFVPTTPPSASGADVLCTRFDGVTTVTVTLSEAAPVGGCTVDYATQDLTAIAGRYYTAKTGTFTFAQGETTKSTTVTIAA